MESIMGTLKNAAMIFQAGGGVGYNFSKLRPEGDYVKSTHGVASGPISFMKLYDAMTETIKQGGVRRGANMGILNSNHPDIEKFISVKEGNKTLKNFNISVLMMSDFWDYLKKGKPYPLINPHNQKIVKEINPKELFDKIVFQAWHSAEPGVIFEDRANEHNPLLKFLGPIRSTNPCGELLLYPYESCNLGSLNLWHFAEKKDNKKEINWDSLAKTIYQAVYFLDNVVDINFYPLEKIEEMTLATRKIGLGIMGLGDLLYDLEIPYNSKEGLKKIEEIIEFVNYHSKVASINLAKERGAFPYFKNSSYIDGELPFSGIEDKKSWHFDWKKVSKDIAKNGLRNTYTTAIAPTGSISMIAGCSSGMEPVYSLIFEKNVAVGNFYYLDPVFEEKFRKEGLMRSEILNEINAHGGSMAKINGIPERLKKIFVTAHDISPEDHVRALAAVQKWVDSSVSKTNNFPASATVKDVEEVYLLAHKIGCKDVTVFRDTSIKDQVLVGGKIAKAEEKIIAAKDEKAEGLVVYPEESAKTKEASSLEVLPLEKIKEPEVGAPKKCPSCGGQLIKQEGCVKCPVCGWGACL
jgi:ribonucleoside-diphosphate reductase alpha chain